MRQINVSLGQRSYPILIGPGLLGRADERLNALPVKRWAVVADETAASLYAGSLGLPVYAFPAGEGSKCLAVYESLCRRMLADGFTRADGIVALGGGVAGDLAGFLAGTILRGVPLVQMPTTLLAQVDSSVGGKTGLDLPEGKNLIGCFYQPSLVLADTDCLGTLPRRQLSSGMAEVIKCGVIGDEEILRHLEAAAEPDFPWLVERCCRYKAAVVARDERDGGPRRLLNFGHGLGGQELLDRLTPLLERWELPVRLPWDGAADYLARDKKRAGDQVTIAVAQRAGAGRLMAVPLASLLEVE